MAANGHARNPIHKKYRCLKGFDEKIAEFSEIVASNKFAVINSAFVAFLSDNRQREVRPIILEFIATYIRRRICISYRFDCIQLT